MFENYMRAVDNEGFLDVKSGGRTSEEGEATEGAMTEDEDEEGGLGGGGWKSRYCILKDGALSVYQVCM